MEEREERIKKGGSGPGGADLHVHTAFSDGAYPPADVVRMAKERGVSVLSITDHDNVAGLPEAMEWGNRLGVEIIPGLELSVALGDKDVHLLAYFFDMEDTRLLEYLSFFRQERIKRAERIVAKLNKINVPLTMDAVLDQAGVGAVGRPHIASAMVEEGLIETYHQAFLKYIGTGAPAYEKKYQLNPQAAVSLVQSAGGLAFLAHPGKYTTDAELFQLIATGVDGIEVVHPSHSETRQEYYRDVANQYFLLESGGSDFHGGKRSDETLFGTCTVPISVVDQMKSRLFS